MILLLVLMLKWIRWRVWKMILKWSSKNSAEELVDIDFEISVTSTSSDAHIIAEVSGHADIDDEE